MINNNVLQMSCRKDFVLEVEFSDSLHPQIRWRGTKETVPYGDLYQVFKGKKIENVLILVHGYRGIYETIERKYGIIESCLMDSFDLVVEYYWPGSWESTIGYVAADNRTKESSEFFMIGMDALFSLQIFNNVKTTVISAHSLGNKVVLEGLRHMTPLELKRLGNIKFIMASPALNIDEINSEKYDDVMNAMESVYVVYSEKDPVLKYAFRFVPSNWFAPAFIFRRNEVRRRNVLMMWYNLTSELGAQHGNYLESKTYFEKVLRI